MKRTPIRRGFTLVELMVVVVIIGIIGSISFVYFMNRPGETRWEAARVEMQEIKKALDMYKLAHGVYPESLDAVSDQFANNQVPRDPFSKQPYQYERGQNGESFKLTFLGKDGQEGEAPVPDKDVVMTEKG